MNTPLVKKFYIPAEFGMYNDEFSEFIQSINDFLDNTGNHKVLCLLQTGSNSDLNQSLYDQLYHDVTFDEVYEKILLVRKTLARIQTCGLISISSSFHDCFGSIFELFLSCQYRLNFDSDRSYGFNEILGDFFPCAGTFEQLLSSKPLTVERVKETGQLSAKEAADLGLIHFSINADNHFELTDAWIASNFNRLTARHTPSIHKNDDSFRRLTVDTSKMRKLKIDLSTDYCFQNRSPRAFPFCEEIIKNPPKNLTSTEVKALSTYMTARYALTPRFKGWFKSWLKKKEGQNAAVQNESKLTPVFSVYPYVPPAQPLANALLAGQNLVFYSESSTHLKNGIDLFVGRLEQQVGKERSIQILKEQINWVHAKADELLGYQIVFETHSQFLVCRGDRKFRFYHTLSSKIDPDGIMAEHSEEHSKPLPAKISALLKSFCEGILLTRSPFPTQTPLIMLIRSIFLEELAQLCRKEKISLEHILECLRVSGWKFASEPSSWEYFMRGRQIFSNIADKHLCSFVVPIDTRLWRLGLWKELRNELKTSANTNRSVTFISRHFMALTCFIVQKLNQLDSGLTKEQLDKYTCKALGVPSHYGTVERYTYAWGAMRLHDYQQHHWEPKK